MLDALAKIGPVAVSGFGALIALLVYRLNSEKLFLEMLAARRDAVREVFDAAHARELEAARIDLAALEAAGYDLPDQARFWRARNVAQGLFGVEVGEQLGRLDNALGAYTGARWSVRGPHLDVERQRLALSEHSAALERLAVARQGLSDAVKPYVNLGRRGLPVIDRLMLLRRGRRQASASQNLLASGGAPKP